MSALLPRCDESIGRRPRRRRPAQDEAAAAAYYTANCVIRGIVVVWGVVSGVAVGAEVELAERSGDLCECGIVAGQVIPHVLEDGTPGEAVGTALSFRPRVIPAEEPLGWRGCVKRICRPSRAGRERLEGLARVPLCAVKFELDLVGRLPIPLHQARMQQNCRRSEERDRSFKRHGAFVRLRAGS